MSISRKQILSDFIEKMKVLEKLIEKLNKKIHEPVLNEKNQSIDPLIRPLDLYLQDIDVNIEADDLKAFMEMQADFEMMVNHIRANPDSLSQPSIDDFKARREGFDDWITKINKIDAKLDMLVESYKKNGVSDKVEITDKNTLIEKAKTVAALVRKMKTESVASAVKAKAEPAVVAAAGLSSQKTQETMEKVSKDLTSFKAYWVSIGQEGSYLYRKCDDLIDSIHHNTFNIAADSEDMQLIAAMSELVMNYQVAVPQSSESTLRHAKESGSAPDSASLLPIANEKPLVLTASLTNPELTMKVLPAAKQNHPDPVEHEEAVAAAKQKAGNNLAAAASSLTASTVVAPAAQAASQQSEAYLTSSRGLVETLTQLGNQSETAGQRMPSDQTPHTRNTSMLTALANKNADAAAAKINIRGLDRNQYNELARKSEKDFFSNWEAKYKKYKVKSAEYIYAQLKLPQGKSFQIQSDQSIMTRAFIEDAVNGPQVEVKISAQSTLEQIADYLLINQDFATPLVMQQNYPMFLKMVEAAQKANMNIDQNSDNRQLQFDLKDLARLKSDTSLEAMAIKEKYAHELTVNKLAPTSDLELRSATPANK